ncbi:hypothetical protein QFC22_005429 [Naganishia vaughanmartiniae]|uniref:Uncharacterized protein n=1 Tax=Naganishia vaughanmartiniae TaxID=1424756 RepID=A0ACC2WUW4_9TREE|nr:hypothetical protein QFC22_005429 [Naganishia vaughanmartiniae]
MSGKRVPPPLPPKPGSVSRINTAATNNSNTTSRTQPEGLNNPMANPRRPTLGSSTSSSFSFSASASSWASKAKSGLNNYAKPMAKAALVGASNYVEAASDYLHEGRTGEERSRSDDDSPRSRGLLRRLAEPQERLNLLPQWTVCVPRKNKAGEVIQHESGIPEFDLHVHVTGYYSSLTAAENAPTLLKVALRIMRSVAALPPLISEGARQFEDNLSTSPVSTPVLEKFADQVDQDMVKARSKPTRSSTLSSINTVSSRTSGTDNSAERLLANITEEQLQALHANLEERLAPFRSSVSQRRVQVSIYPIVLDDAAQSQQLDDIKPNFTEKPLITNVFTTSPQGLFSHKIVIPWERIISHGPSLQLAFSGLPISNAYNPSKGLYIHAQLLTDGGPGQLPSSASSLSPTKPGESDKREFTGGLRSADSGVTRVDDGANAFFSSIVKPVAQGSGGEMGGLQSLGKTEITASVFSNISSTGGVRIISDLDDTVKYSNILGGAREAFRNAFCRAVADVGIEGMSDLYRTLADAGVAGYHYVSNSPNELFPVLQSFFRHHHFPGGYSLMLKYYGGKHLVNAFLEEPGDRKRPGVMAVIDSFPEAKFILIGDSGEQDLELYVAVAKARPDRILAIAIRDVSTAVAAKTKRSPNRQPTTSEIDVDSLTDALGHVDGQDQAAKAGIGGRKRDAAKKLFKAPSGLDLRNLRLSSSPSEANTPASSHTDPRRQGSGSSISSLTDSKTASSTLLSTRPEENPSLSSQLIPDFAVLQDKISSAGASGPSSDASITMEEEIKEAEEEFQELSATQAKLLKRAAEWSDRMKRASHEVPEGVALIQFREPDDIEETLLQMVKSHS